MTNGKADCDFEKGSSLFKVSTAMIPIRFEG